MTAHNHTTVIRAAVAVAISAAAFGISRSN